MLKFPLFFWALEDIIHIGEAADKTSQTLFTHTS